MGRCSNRASILTALLGMLAVLMAVPAPVMGQHIITNINALQDIGKDDTTLAGTYELGGDIDGTDNATGLPKNFIPIGTEAHPFTGTFDGKNYKISNLTINRPTMQCVGLFGCVAGAPATIKNVNIDTAAISGGSFTGALVGKNVNCIINTCYSSGAVTGNDYVGGLVGWSQSEYEMKNCYSTSSVSGDLYTGGLIGYNVNSLVRSCYSAGTVTASAGDAGGLIGYSSNLTAITNCFWDATRSKQSTSAGGTSKTTAEMWRRSTFTSAGWDYTKVWGQFDGSGYPFFRKAAIPPVAAGDSYQVIKSSLTVEKPGVLANDDNSHNLNGDSMTAVLVQNVSHGTLTLSKDGDAWNGGFAYTPNGTFTSTDTFTYQAVSGGAASAIVTVTLVAAIAPPAAQDQTFTAYMNSTFSGTLTLADKVTAFLAGVPQHGTITSFDSTDGGFSYQPERDFTGTDTFTYFVFDGVLPIAPATVSITVFSYCAIDSVYGESSPEASVLRRFRDEVLATTAAGRLGIHLYYKMSQQAEGFVENSGPVREMVKKIVGGALPWIKARLPQQR